MQLSSVKGLLSSVGSQASINNFVNYVRRVNVGAIEDSFVKEGISAKFYGDKLNAAASRITANIYKMLGLPLPKSIKVVREFTFDKGCRGLAKPDGRVYFKSLKGLTPEQMVELWKVEGYYGFNTTGHFLRAHIHEFAHNLHFRNLERVAPQISVGDIMGFHFSEPTKKYLTSTCSMYGAKNLGEFTAEEITGKIVASMNDNLAPTLSILKHGTTYKDQLFEAAWNGKLKEAEAITQKIDAPLARFCRAVKEIATA